MPSTLHDCFDQEAAAEQTAYVESGFRAKNSILSHIVDINGDGKYEIIVTSLLAPTDIASSTIWPDTYALVGGHYQYSDSVFKKYYKSLYPIVVDRLEHDPGNAGLKAMKVRIREMLKEPSK